MKNNQENERQIYTNYQESVSAPGVELHQDYNGEVCYPTQGSPDESHAY